MGLIQRIRVSVTGFPGGPGVSTFYALDGTAAVAPLSSFFAALVTRLPSDFNFQVVPSGDIIVAETGLLSGGWAGGTPTPGKGTELGSTAGPAGLLVHWETGAVLFGKHIRGRTFIVPAAGTGYGADGQVTAGAQAAVNTAATNLIAAVAGNLQVWSRPRVAHGPWTDVRGKIHPAVSSRPGAAQPITSGKCSAKVAVLTSRRD